MAVQKAEILQIYTTMLTIRRFEERVAQDYANHVIPGLVHSYIGQEAVAAGVCANLRVDDRIVSTHRGHGHCIAKGAGIERMMAELYGRKTGYCKGKGGSMHIADFGVGMLGANGIVGAGLPIAVGAAMAAQLEGGDRVAVSFFGDGACQEGAFHEAVNLASIWKLPIVFVCENNLYGSVTPAKYAIPIKDIAERARAYAVPGVVLDGNDVLAVHEAAHEAVARARAREGPSFLECKTYRWHAHAESGAFADFRPADEIAEWKKRCPIVRLERKLRDDGTVTQAELDAIDQSVQAQIAGAVSFAEHSPWPEPQDALEGVFSQ
ncbi:MAG: thiamine pyrophosphate-dependent dehydrogenase E1 component subunit alpha [Chloroflexi bacterium]|nr:thiamine pyrophosphate-dependent dehydrogenase E1 component subunit alpha [Chloroflexota bacterium]